jgi:hypothetical protein
MPSKYVYVVFEKGIMTQNPSSNLAEVVVCKQMAGRIQTAGNFSTFSGRPLFFYIFAFRISCLRKSATTIVNKVKAEIQALRRSLLVKYIGRNLRAREL